MKGINVSQFCEGFNDSNFISNEYFNDTQVNPKTHQIHWTDITLESFFTQLVKWFQEINIPVDEQKYYTGKFNTFCRSLQTIMQNNQYPSDFFDDLGFGSYKECYESGIPGWVIKFASSTNPTKEEIKGLDDAMENDMLHLLPKTYYFDLPYSIPLGFLEQEPNPEYEDDDDEAPEAWINQFADCIILQEQCNNMVDYCEGYNNELKIDMEGDKTIELNGEVFKKADVLSLNWIDETWLTLVLEKYGKSGLLQLNNFLEQFGWDDLRPVNIGVNSQGLPVIFDWMSPCA